MGRIKKIHAKLDHDLGLNNAYIDKIYICPHHPDKGFSGEVEDLKINVIVVNPKQN